MLPQRFPKSCIRAKVFVRKIGFKLHVTRLNRVELFYAFLLHFRSEGSKERGWSATVRPSTTVAGHGQAPYRDRRPWPGHLQASGGLWPRPPVGVAHSAAITVVAICSTTPTYSGGGLRAQRPWVGLRTRWPRKATPPARRDYRPRAVVPDHGQRRPLLAGSTTTCTTTTTTTGKGQKGRARASF
ncbi:hypothetical protein BHM03_00020893 [Ensete ventricosum]|nr:hypothetical protein BHM03_00020893 [Ensete ventricosum]